VFEPKNIETPVILIFPKYQDSIALLGKDFEPRLKPFPKYEVRDAPVIPPLLMSVKSRGAINYSNFLGGTPPIAE